MKLRYKIIYTFLSACLACFSAAGQVNLPLEGALPAISGTPLSYYLIDFGGLDLDNPVFFNYDRVLIPSTPVSTIATWQNVNVSTSFKNGWGQPLQTIGKSKVFSKDVIVPFDNRLSNMQLSFQPYTQTSNYTFEKYPFDDQQSFHNATTRPDYNIESGYSFSVNKLVVDNQSDIVYQKQYAAGATMAGSERGTTSYTLYNTSSDGNLPIWQVNSTGKPEIVGYYGYGQVRIDITQGQHNADVRQYFDKKDQLLFNKVKAGASWLTTYYVYDEMGKLTWIIPPKVSASLSTIINTIPSQAALDNLCTNNKYDEYGLLISSKVPDQPGENLIVYDQWHRAVLSQSPLLKQQAKWAFSVYDDMGRVRFSGLVSSGNTAAQWKTALAGTPAAGTITHYLAKGVEFGFMPPTSLSGCEINVIDYYDSYDNLPSPLSSRPYSTSHLADYLTGTSMRPHEIDPHKTYGLLVGSKVRVLDPTNPNLWINTVVFYDKFGRLMQTHTQNHWNTNDWDVSYNQYNFKGDLVLNIFDHYGWAGVNKASTSIMTKYEYDDNLSKLTAVRQNVDNTGWQVLALYTYGENNLLTEKYIGNVEYQRYNYNIRGQLTGINNRYVRDSNFNDRITFGESIYYDYGFQNNRYDGSIAGYMWRGNGKASVPRAYGYGYDAAHRLTYADYNQRARNFSGTGATWSTDKYSTWNMAYDENGNITTMNAKDLVAGAEATVDQLSYRYRANSNQLRDVKENASNHASNDFLDGNVDTTDYDYDANGNLIKDLNKAVTSITYNYMNKPTQVISGGGSINYIYDGAGNLLQKKTTVAGIDTTYRYWGPFEYRDTKLMQFTHQEGRSRWMPDSTKFKHDFFIKDHLGNVRSIVTADISYGNQQYWAGFELAAALTEQALFTQVGEIRDTKPSGTPGDLMSGQLDGSDPSKRIGTALLFKAHPGDQVDLRTWGYYEEADSADMNIYAPSEDMFTALTNTFSSGLVGGGEGGAPTVTPGVISGILTNTNYNIYESMKNAVTDNAYPRLYLNCLVFDDALNLLPDQSSVTQLRGGSNTWNPLDRNTTWQVEAENYVLVYVSMESTKKIYIDNTNIVVINGRQLQEQHYYPYGRLIEQQTPSVPSLTSNYLYQTKKLEKTANLELYDFHARQYDAQIGRFCAVDPMQEFASGYVGMGNDPANLVDPTGMQTSTSPTASGPPMDPAYDPNTWNKSGPTKGAPVAYARSSLGWTPVDILFDGETTDVEFFPDLQGKSVLVLGGKGGKATGTIDRIVGGRLMFKDYSYNNFIPFSSPQYDPMWSANATDLWRGGITESVFVGNYSLRFHMSSHMYQTTSNLERTLKTVAKYLRAADEFLNVGARQNGYEYTSKNIYRGNEAHRNPKAKKLYGIIDVDMIVNAMNTFGAGSGQFGKLSNTLGAWEGFAGAADATHTAIDEYGATHHGEATFDTTKLQNQAYRVISRDSSGTVQRTIDYFD